MGTLTTVLFIVHLMIAAGLVGVVLLQRSEGGALGIGGGGGFMTGRGAANFLTRVTAALAVAFFATSMLLTMLAARTDQARSIFDTPAAGKAQPADKSAPPADKSAPPAPTDSAPRGGVLDKLGPVGPRVPQSQ